MKFTPVGNKSEIGVETSYYGVKITIARDTNTKYRAAFRRLSRPYKDELENGTLDEATSESILNEAAAEGLLVGWDSSTVPGGTPYSKEAAMSVLAEDPDLRNFVMKFAGDITNFLDDDAGKVKKES